MGRIQTMKAWGVLSFLAILMNAGSLSYGQTNTFPSSGNVGIGTTSPAALLDVAGSLRSTGFFLDNSYLNVIGPSDTSSATVRYYRAGEAASAHWFAGKGWENGNNFIFAHGSDDSADVKMLVGANGNVGIGTTSPTSKLHVAGNARITGDLTTDGNIAAKYQDVAEWVRSPAQLAPGTVVVIDPKEANRVIPASQAYDTRIAGVVSAQPGIILGEAGEDKAKVAHSGRVKVKVDAQYGPVEVGNLLVSSETPGYAMRSTPMEVNGISLHRPGTIVGKALEPLKEGQGEILVLLTLQ